MSQAGRRSHLVASLVASAVTVLAASPAVEYSRSYHRRAAYHFDSASYRWQAVDASRELQARGLGAAVGRTLRRKDALDQSLRLLLMPRSLTLRYGHLFVALPFLWLFLFLLAGYVLERTGSTSLAFLACALILPFPLLYLPRLGLADDLPEATATWLLGTAVLCWIRAEGLTKPGWAALCGLFLGLVAAQRTVAAVFALVLFVPPVGVALLRRRGEARTVAAGLVAMLAPLGLVGASLALLQGATLVRYYSVGYSYARFEEVLRFEQEMGQFAATPGALLIGAAVLTASLLWPPRGPVRSEVVTALWFAVALPFVVAAFSALYVGVVWLWLGLLVLLPASAMRAVPEPRHRAAFVLLAAATAAATAVAHTMVARQPVPATSIELRGRNDALIAALPSDPRPLRVQLLIDDSELLFLNQAFFDAGRRAWHKGPALVSQHDSFYTALFGDQPPEEVAQALVGILESQPGVRLPGRVGSGWFGSADEAPDTWVIGYCDPADVDEEASFLAGGTTRARPIVRLLNEHVARSDRWRAERRVELPRVGCVIVYRRVPGQGR